MADAELDGDAGDAPAQDEGGADVVDVEHGAVVVSGAVALRPILYGYHPPITRRNRPDCVECGRRLEKKNRRARNRPQPTCKTCGPIVREARHLAHRTFDAVWRSRIMPRAHAVRWMEIVLGLRRGGGRVSKLSAAQCFQLRAAVHAEFDLMTGTPRDP